MSICNVVAAPAMQSDSCMPLPAGTYEYMHHELLNNLFGIVVENLFTIKRNERVDDAIVCSRDLTAIVIQNGPSETVH